MTTPLVNRLAAHADHARRLDLTQMSTDISEAIAALKGGAPGQKTVLQQRLEVALRNAIMLGNETVSITLDGVRDIIQTWAEHDARVTELLEANNREVERRRAAEQQLAASGAPSRSIDRTAPRPANDDTGYWPVLLPMKVGLFNTTIVDDLGMELHRSIDTIWLQLGSEDAGLPRAVATVRIAEALEQVRDWFEHDTRQCELCDHEVDPDTGFQDASDHAETCPVALARIALAFLDRLKVKPQLCPLPAQPADANAPAGAAGVTQNTPAAPTRAIIKDYELKPYVPLAVPRKEA